MRFGRSIGFKIAGPFLAVSDRTLVWWADMTMIEIDALRSRTTAASVRFTSLDGDERRTLMTDPGLQAQIDSANAYEELFVPALFQEWAPRVVHAADLHRGDRVLDIACGTGVLARQAAARIGSNGSVTGLDCNAGMIEVAKRLAPEVVWRQGNAESLPFPDDSFDAVISQFGLMFFSDRTQALREMLRVLSPGGRLAVAVWNSIDNSPAYAAEVALLERVAGQEAADALRAPFALGDRVELERLFTDIGAEPVTITTQQGLAQFPTIASMVEADLRAWLPAVGVQLSEDQIQLILQEAEQALSTYRTGKGTVFFDCPAHIVVSTKPKRQR